MSTDIVNGIDFPPGTEIVDSSGREIEVHHPQPTSDPNDPLNWTKRWKTLTFCGCQLYVFWATLSIFSLGPLYPYLTVEFSASATQISDLTSYMTLALGFVNFVFIPIGMAYGRRPMVLISNILTFACVLWFSLAKSYHSAFAARLLQGAASSALEIVGPLNIADLYFTSQRGFYHSMSFMILILASALAAPVAGAFADSPATWRGFFYLVAAGIGASQFAIYLIFPETRWKREPDTTAPLAPTGVAILEPVIESAEKDGDKVLQPDAATVQELPVEGGHVSVLGRGAPNPQQRWALFPPRDTSYKFLKEATLVFRMLEFPATWLASIWWMAYGGQAAALGYVSAQIWSVPPYNFSSTGIGLTSIPGVVGNVLGFLVIGPLSDWDLARRVRNNGGIREPEMRLPLLIPGGVLVVVGNLIFAFGVSRGWHWAIPLIFGQGLINFAVAGPIAISTSYAIDTYKMYAGEILFNMTLVKNIWTFGAGFFLNNLYARSGSVVALNLLALPVYFALALTFVFLYFGKPMRRWTANSSLLKEVR